MGVKFAPRGASWLVGGAEAFDMIADNDANGIAPGSNLLEAIFEKYAPCLILIDEWVAYLRQIYKVEGLPSGSFDSNLSFVQSLAEAVKATPRTLLVASLPASQIEVGGEGGEKLLIASSNISPNSALLGAPPIKKRAMRSSDGGCSRKFPATSSITATTR